METKEVKEITQEQKPAVDDNLVARFILRHNYDGVGVPKLIFCYYAETVLHLIEKIDRIRWHEYYKEHEENDGVWYNGNSSYSVMRFLSTDVTVYDLVYQCEVHFPTKELHYLIHSCYPKSFDQLISEKYDYGLKETATKWAKCIPKPTYEDIMGEYIDDESDGE